MFELIDEVWEYVGDAEYCQYFDMGTPAIGFETNSPDDIPFDLTIVCENQNTIYPFECIVTLMNDFHKEDYCRNEKEIIEFIKDLEVTFGGNYQDSIYRQVADNKYDENHIFNLLEIEK